MIYYLVTFLRWRAVIYILDTYKSLLYCHIFLQICAMVGCNVLLQEGGMECTLTTKYERMYYIYIKVECNKPL